MSGAIESVKGYGTIGIANRSRPTTSSSPSSSPGFDVEQALHVLKDATSVLPEDNHVLLRLVDAVNALQVAYQQEHLTTVEQNYANLASQIEQQVHQMGLAANDRYNSYVVKKEVQVDTCASNGNSLVKRNY